MKYEYKVTFVRWFRDRNGDWDFDNDQEYFLTEKLAERFIEVNSNKKLSIFNDSKIIKLESWESNAVNNNISYNY